MLPPVLVFEVPLDGFAEAGLKGFAGFPAEVGADLGGIDGVAEVVAGAIGDKDDERGVGLRAGPELI